MGKRPSVKSEPATKKQSVKNSDTAWYDGIIKQANKIVAAGGHPAESTLGVDLKELRAMAGELECSMAEATLFDWQRTMDPLRVPLDTFKLERPTAGYPPAIDWLTHLRDIVSNNFDSRREAVDIRPGLQGQIQGQFAIVKGFTRISIIMFAWMQIAKVTKESLSAADLVLMKQLPPLIVFCWLSN